MPQLFEYKDDLESCFCPDVEFNYAEVQTNEGEEYYICPLLSVDAAQWPEPIEEYCVCGKCKLCVSTWSALAAEWEEDLIIAANRRGWEHDYSKLSQMSELQG